MGQAKQKAKALEVWRNSLSPQEGILAEVAYAAYRRFVQPRRATGICYRMTFFLAAHLQIAHDIQTSPIVGFVNDGTGDAMASHAWLEYGGKKTDISLTFTADPTAQPSGPLLILDRVFHSGVTNYSYHLQRSTMGQKIIDGLMSDKSISHLIAHKEQEHQDMERTSKSLDAIIEYLDNAPDGFNYKAMAQLICPNTLP